MFCRLWTHITPPVGTTRPASLYRTSWTQVHCHSMIYWKKLLRNVQLSVRLYAVITWSSTKVKNEIKKIYYVSNGQIIEIVQSIYYIWESMKYFLLYLTNNASSPAKASASSHLTSILWPWEQRACLSVKFVFLFICYLQWWYSDIWTIFLTFLSSVFFLFLNILGSHFMRCDVKGWLRSQIDENRKVNILLNILKFLAIFCVMRKLNNFHFRLNSKSRNREIAKTEKNLHVRTFFSHILNFEIKIENRLKA